jgi:hypothetical protein
MGELRYSVMVLPRHADGSLLLQSWTNKTGGVITDGFGSFYSANENSKDTAERVFTETFGTIDHALFMAAQLQYHINKPSGLVDLRVSVYFAHTKSELPLAEHISWFLPSQIPYDQIHPATGKWLPLLLTERTATLRATIEVEQPGDHTTGTVTQFKVANEKA